MRLIDADALWAQMKEFHEKRAEEANMTGDRVVCVTWHDSVIIIKNAPTVNVPDRKVGKWVKMTGMMPPEYFGHYECSECGWHLSYHDKTKETELGFCPGCGSYNGGGDEQND